MSFASAEAPRFVCAVEMGRNGVSAPRDDTARAGCGNRAKSDFLSFGASELLGDRVRRGARTGADRSQRGDPDFEGVQGVSDKGQHLRQHRDAASERGPFSEGARALDLRPAQRNGAFCKKMRALTTEAEDEPSEFGGAED